MNITGNKTIIKKCLLTDPNNESPIRALIKPQIGIGFTFDRQKVNNIMVFAVHVTYSITYNANVNFAFECYDGTIFNSYSERPISQSLLLVVQEAVKRINEILIKKLSENKILLSENTDITFGSEEILNLLDADINDAYAI